MSWMNNQLFVGMVLLLFGAILSLIAYLITTMVKGMINAIDEKITGLIKTVEKIEIELVKHRDIFVTKIEFEQVTKNLDNDIKLAFEKYDKVKDRVELVEKSCLIHHSHSREGDIR